MKILIAILCFLFTLQSNAKLLDDSSWFAACGLCLDKLCGDFFVRFSNIRVIPSGSSMCKRDKKVLSSEDWRTLLKSNELELPDKVFQKRPLIQVYSYEELIKPFEKIGGVFKPNVKSAIDKFLSRTNDNPVILYSLNADEMMILMGTSDGETISLNTDVFRKPSENEKVNATN